MKLQNFYDKKSFMLICLMMGAQNLMGSEDEKIRKTQIKTLRDASGIGVAVISWAARNERLITEETGKKGIITGLMMLGDHMLPLMSESLVRNRVTPDNERRVGTTVRWVYRLGSLYGLYRMNQEPCDKVLSYANETVGKPLWGVASKVLASSIDHASQAGTAGSHYMAQAIDIISSKPAIQQAVCANIAFGSLIAAVETENQITRSLAVGTGALALRLGFELPGVAQSALVITAGTTAALAAGSYMSSGVSKVLQPQSFWAKCNTPLIQKMARYATIATGLGVFGYLNSGFVKSCYTSALSGLYSFGNYSQSFYNVIPQRTMNLAKNIAILGTVFAIGRMSNSHKYHNRVVIL